MSQVLAPISNLTVANGDALTWGARTYVMGIINLTPDSFSGDGLGADVESAVELALRFQEEGADILDIGAESTRPGHEKISIDEELNRLMPSLEAVAKRVDLPISVDTYKAAVAKKAVDAGLRSRPWVKTSLAPGSRVVTQYLEKAGLTPYLDELGFSLVGYGCTTCIGNSGPLPEEVARRVDDENLTVAAVLSGNRNFEGRIHSKVKASYLASPPLVVAYALLGTVLGDLTRDPLGNDSEGKPVYLKDIWPTAAEIEALVASSVAADQFEHEYGRIFEGDDKWKGMPAPTGTVFEWSDDSDYVREPPFFLDFAAEPSAPTDIEGAYALAVLGDSITTDHISPAGAIGAESPAGRYLSAQGVPRPEFNSFGSRRGNHEVMMRGTFGNIRLRNQMAPGTEGPWTVHMPSGDEMSIYDAAMRYRDEGTPLIVIAGREYGSGSSRDWAAKGPALLGVKAVIAHSYERIHRSNLVCMGVLPLQVFDGESAKSLGLTGREHYSITGMAGGIEPRQSVAVTATSQEGSPVTFQATVRIDAQAEIDYFVNGGILDKVLRKLLRS